MSDLDTAVEAPVPDAPAYEAEAPPKLSLRDRVASSNDIETRLVPVPMWGVDIEVRSMNAKARAAMVQQAAEADGGGVNFERLYPDLVILCSFDPETGEKAFTEEDRDMLLERHAGAVELVASAAMEVSGMAAKAVEEAGKSSSSATLPDDSTSS